MSLSITEKLEILRGEGVKKRLGNHLHHVCVEQLEKRFKEEREKFLMDLSCGITDEGKKLLKVYHQERRDDERCGFYRDGNGKRV